MKRTKLHENARLGKPLSRQKCVHCNGYVLIGRVGISISKPTVSGNPINMWMHIGCVRPFFEEIEEECKKHEKMILVENL